jgi:uncharacterized RDD family membrane protein YckC
VVKCFINIVHCYACLKGCVIIFTFALAIEMINTYYILQDGEKTGPYTQYELMDMDIDVKTMVLSPLGNDWQHASELPEFYEYFESKGIYFPTEDNLATFWWRLLAYVIDYIVLVIIVMIFGVGLGVVLTLTGYPVDKFDAEKAENKILLNLAGIVVNILYHSVFEATYMRGSIGKVVCKLAVVDADGQKLSFGRALKRNFGKILSSIAIGIGFLNILWDEHRQGWHDQIAKTYVILRK